jgi:hypothetical protein
VVMVEVEGWRFGVGACLLSLGTWYDKRYIDIGTYKKGKRVEKRKMYMHKTTWHQTAKPVKHPHAKIQLDTELPRDLKPQI